MRWPRRKPKIPAGYDPNFPFFIRQRELIEQQAKRVHRQRRKERVRQRLMVLRPTRRAAAMAGVLSLIAASAGAVALNSQGSSSSTPRTTAPSPIASGTANGERWTLRTWYDAGELCFDLVAGDAEQSICNLAPTAAQVQPLTLRSPVNDYTFGLTGPQAQAASVKLAGRAVTVPTHDPSSAALATGLPPSVRWFLTSTPRDDT